MRHLGRYPRMRASNMNTAQAIKVVNSLHLQPGWTVTAREPSTFRDYMWASEFGSEQVIMVTFHFEAPNSSDYPNYRRMIPMDPGGPIDVTAMTSPAEVQDACFKMQVELIVHEAREFFGVQRNGTVDKPYHPHTDNGARRWRGLGFKGFHMQDDVIV
jgi:hypothetical protein